MLAYVHAGKVAEYVANNGEPTEAVPLTEGGTPHAWHEIDDIVEPVIRHHGLDHPDELAEKIAKNIVRTVWWVTQVNDKVSGETSQASISVADFDRARSALLEAWKVGSIAGMALWPRVLAMAGGTQLCPVWELRRIQAGGLEPRASVMRTS